MVSALMWAAPGSGVPWPPGGLLPEDLPQGGGHRKGRGAEGRAQGPMVQLVRCLPCLPVEPMVQLITGYTVNPVVHPKGGEPNPTTNSKKK